MPTFVSSHFAIDLQTVCVVTGFITVIGGLLLLFAWLQNRSESGLALWGLGYLLGAAGAALLASGGRIPAAWSIGAADALICCAYGVLWGGARSFEGRRVRLSLVVCGAAVWIAACQFGGFYASVQARVLLPSAIAATYLLLAAREVWYARDCQLISRWPTLALLVLHAGFMLLRIPFAGELRLASAMAEPQRIVFFVMAFEALFAAFCLAFLRVSMAKERAELEQRKTALADSLTGIANRRAFFEFGSTLLARAIAERLPVALLLFDLDRFKEINDTAGHPAGDRVLRAFATLVAAALRPGDLFARIGGEEFACLVPDSSMAQALHLADRLRREFAALRFGTLPDVSVSVGVAMAGENGGSLSALLANADRALYRAKREGRNRVAPPPPVLVDAGGAAAVANAHCERADRTVALAASLTG